VNLSAPQTELQTSSIAPSEATGSTLRDRCIAWLENAIFAVIVILVLAIPHPTRIVLYAFRAIWLLWALRLLFGRNHLRMRPLYLPVFAFVVLVFLATVHSYEPLLSWDRIERFTEAFLVLPIAENLRSMRRMKWLVALLLASSMVSAARTGWQYVHGIGTRLVTVAPGSALGRSGVLSNDIVQAINGHPTRTPEQWREAIAATRNDAQLHLRLARAWPYYERVDRVVPRAALDEWLAWPGAKIARGRPVRAQGHFYHYVPYAGLMMLLGLIAFGLVLTCPATRFGLRVVLAGIFAALLACLVATVSRAHLGAFLVAALIIFCIQVRGPLRMAAVALFVVAVIAGSMWLRKERGVSWYSAEDAGTEYRLLMWRDGVRLVREHPLLGIGPDSEMGDTVRWNLEAYRRYPLIGHFHSSPVEIAVTCGLPALAALVWVFAAYFGLLIGYLKRVGRLAPTRQSFADPTRLPQELPLPAAQVVSKQPAIEQPQWFPRGLTLGLLGGAIALVITSFVHYIVGDAEVMILVWVMMSLAAAITTSLATDDAGLANTQRPA